MIFMIFMIFARVASSSEFMREQVLTPFALVIAGQIEASATGNEAFPDITIYIRG